MTDTKVSAAGKYIERLRRLDDNELAEEAGYLAAAVQDPPQHTDAALSPERRAMLVEVERAWRERGAHHRAWGH
jgi:hypothetical protein